MDCGFRRAVHGEHGEGHEGEAGGDEDECRPAVSGEGEQVRQDGVREHHGRGDVRGDFLGNGLGRGAGRGGAVFEGETALDARHRDHGVDGRVAFRQRRHMRPDRSNVRHVHLADFESGELILQRAESFEASAGRDYFLALRVEAPHEAFAETGSCADDEDGGEIVGHDGVLDRGRSRNFF